MNAVNIIFRDYLFAVVLIFLLMINPVSKESAQDIESPGNLMVTTMWPQHPDDVDLWVRPPGEKTGVGYSRKDGDVFNLLRDDLGSDTDKSGQNYENGFSRGLPDGEYIVNLHCFKCTSSSVPVFVEVRVLSKGSIQVIFSGTIDMKDREEKTAIRFEIKNGEVVNGSKNDVYEPIFYKEHTK